MELFSKRAETSGQIRRTYARPEFGRTLETRGLIKEALRNRLREQVRYIIRSKQFLERFTYTDNKESGETYLHAPTLSDISMREVGYDISSTYDLVSLEAKNAEFADPLPIPLLDARFFDLIEILIIFSIEDKRAELVDRLSAIFAEEGGEFSIHGYMIVNRENGGLRSVIPLIKEKNLRDRIEEYYNQRRSLAPTYEVQAQISADLVQLIFSSPSSKKDTKTHAEDLCRQVAEKWTSKEKAEELSSLFNETVVNAKALSNQIQNVRHTDRTTIPIEAPDFYKLISSKNINIVELVILSLPEKFISSQNPEAIKSSYLSQYSINKDDAWVVKPRQKEIQSLDEFDPNNIPF